MLHIHMFHCRTNSLITEFCPGTPYTIYIYACVHAKFLQSCPALCNCMECSPPGSFIHGILQARILEWIVMPSAGDLPDPWIEPMSLMSPALASRCFPTSATPGKHTCMPHLLYSPDLSPMTTTSSSISKTFCWENASTTSRSSKCTPRVHQS